MTVKAYPRHLRAVKICHGKGRDWFAARGWSWADFVANGRPAEDFEATGDPFAALVAEAARIEAESKPLRIYLRHLGQVNMCHDGGRTFAARQGWDWQTFLDEGWDANDFLATGDPDAVRIVEAARREARNGRL